MALEIYPHADANGNPIPAEFVYPDGAFIVAVTQIAMGAAIDLFPGKADGVCTVFCVGSPVLIKSGAAVVTAPATGVLLPDSMLILPDTHYMLYLPSNTFSAIGLAGSAELLINRIKPWKALAIPDQFNRG